MKAHLCCGWRLMLLAPLALTVVLAPELTLVAPKEDDVLAPATELIPEEEEAEAVEGSAGSVRGASNSTRMPLPHFAHWRSPPRGVGTTWPHATHLVRRTNLRVLSRRVSTASKCASAARSSLYCTVLVLLRSAYTKSSDTMGRVSSPTAAAVAVVVVGAGTLYQEE